MKFLYTTLFVVLGISSAFAQKQGNQWYFGIYAGLDFNSGTPVPILTSAMSTYEGCASIADKTTGKLLFYTDGSSVWDSTNTVMPNGTGLGGNYSTTQSAVIVPKPGRDSLYYIFTLAAQGAGGLSVNVVDMSLHGGLGEVTATKDSPLVTPATEKCGTYFSCNGDSVWVVVHQWNTNAFYAYLVTANGISAPVISNDGIDIYDIGGSNSEAIGYMRITTDGKKLGLDCEYELNTMQLSDFNSTTGVVSNSVADTAFPGSSGPYGLCFSPDNSKMYVTFNGNNGSNVYQYNMLSGNDSAIIASRTSVAPIGGGAIQQGPDGKLYVVSGNEDYLSVIVNPDLLGSACDFIPNAVYLGGKQSFLGLPDIIPNYNIAGTVQSQSAVICSGQSTILTVTGGAGYSWSPATGLNSTTGDSVIASPTATITYTVTGTTPGGCSFTDSTVVTVLSSPNKPSFTQHNDTLISSSVHDNQWYRNDTLLTNDTSQYLIITILGEYKVNVLNEANGCSTTSDSLNITSLTGVNQLTVNNGQLTVYPNPFNNELFIKINPSAEDVKDRAMQLTDVLGRTLYTVSPLNPLGGTFEINLSDLPDGMYFMMVINKTRRDVVSVVKE